MLRKLLAAAVLALLVAPVAFADEPAKKPEAKKAAKKAPAVDKSKVFDKIDADSDGKITKDEFKKFSDAAVEKIKEKLGDKAAKGGGKVGDLFEKAFDKMDADKDGKVTKEEFEKSEVGGGLDTDKLKALREKLGDAKKKKKPE